MQIYTSIFLKYFNNYNTLILITLICIEMNLLSNFTSSIYFIYIYIKFVFSIYFIFSKFSIF